MGLYRVQDIGTHFLTSVPKANEYKTTDIVAMQNLLSLVFISIKEEIKQNDRKTDIETIFVKMFFFFISKLIIDFFYEIALSGFVQKQACVW